MDEYIPLAMLAEMLSSTTAPPEKRLKLAQEQIAFHERVLEKLRHAESLLIERVKDAEI